MDFSRLHMYSPPQCVPENTGYTYALSSSYSSDALDFETEHKLDPVFDSPRMSRRSLRLVTTAHAAEDGPAVAAAGDRAARVTKQRGSAGRLALTLNHTSRKGLSSAASQSGAGAVQGEACLRPPVLDESLIREQTKVDHFWGLDDDGDLRGGTRAALQGNGDAAGSNGYTCSDCSLLSSRGAALTAHSTSLGPTSRIYSRDRNQRRGASRFADRIWRLAERTSSFSSVLVHLFRGAFAKCSCESENDKLKSCESKARESQIHESQAHCGHGGRMDVREALGDDGRLRVNGESLCDGRKGKEPRETHTHSAPRSPSSRPGGLAGTAGRAFAHAGCGAAVQTLRRAGAAGWFVSRTVLAVLRLALLAPGKTASEVLWWLGVGWYQFVTLISWLNVFLLTRCLRNICKFLILLTPLLLLLGVSLWGQGDVLAFLPVLNWTHVLGAQRADDPSSMRTSGHPPPRQPLEAGTEAFHWHRMSEVERQVTSLSGQCHHHDEKLRELAALLQKLQARVEQMDGGGEGLLSLVRHAVGQRFEEMGAPGPSSSQADSAASPREHELRISSLEAVLGKLTERSEAVQRELERTARATASGMEEEQRLLGLVQRLEQELGRLKADLAGWQRGRSSCEAADSVRETVDARVRETLRLMLSGDQPEASLEWLLQKWSSQFVSKDDLQVLLRELELGILKNVTHHLAVTRQMPTAETVMSAARGAGITGITEEQAQVLVNKALKLYSQDRTGLVDFALESGGGSVLSTRCSETFETKTALISLFGIPLWYFSQSPRVAIQPDMYPGNCWAFRGSQGYLVVRLSMKIQPSAFTLEHIPKTLSPTGNITSAPKDFAVYGLEDEYQEEGQLLGRFTYDQEGESLQTFHIPKRPESAFQIVELRIFSNWGHPEYTCLYRFRVHGEPIK
ncbi:SUN domain-containing protein 1 isoform X3 [Phacochoerus africanus]|uniref:SUN domain-containing protein 1 isoform X3 n=1 Tax=Phacochoerus africanus TaxID=41426 RepID=UPI001FDA7275|nr:SUN domain-containing protein 1 isoform X3 [Phacochoerus africanus]